MPPKTNDGREKLTFDAPVKLLKGSDAELSGFEIMAYTGAEIDRWWGRLVIDLSGIRAEQKMPIFRHHIPTEIVGWSTESRTSDGGFAVRGVFSASTEASEETRALAAEGFPWQASIGVWPLRVHTLADGQTREVNGREVAGPMEIWLESEVKEVSFVPLGADANTKVTVFNECGERNGESNSTLLAPHSSLQKEEGREPMTLEELKQEHPELVEALRAELAAELRPGLLGEGAELERARIADVRAQSIPGHEALIAQMELDGKSDGAAAAKAIVAAERKLRENAAANLAASANPPAPAAAEPESGEKTMKRADFDRLSVARRGETIKAGIRIID